MPDVVEVNDIDELEHYWLAWNSLLPQTPGVSFFQSFDWLRTYWRQFGKQDKLRVLIVYSGGEPIGILPLVVVREPTRVGRVRVLTYPLHDWGTFYGPIGPNPTATLSAALRHVRNTLRDWDLLDLRWVDRDQRDGGRTPLALQMAGFPARVRRWKAAAVIDTSGTWEDYFATRTSKFRNNVRRATKRVEKLGDVSYERYRPRGAAAGDGDPRWEMYDECVDVARASWQGNSATGTTLSHETVQALFRELHAVAARAGALDVNVIRLRGNVIAFAYNYYAHGRVEGQRVGISPQFVRQGVGTVLYSWMFEDSFLRGDELFDLGTDYLDVKIPWLTRIVHSYHYTHYPLAAPRAQLLRAKHWLTDRWGLVEQAGARR